MLAVLADAGDGAGTKNYDQDIDLNGVADGVQHDRSTNPAHSYLSGPPDGGIGLGSDVLLVLAQSGEIC